MKRVVITLEGGIVSGVLSDELIEVVVLDRDVEGMDEDDITEVNGDDVSVDKYQVESNSDAVGIIYSQLED